MITKQYIDGTAEALHAYLEGLTDYFSEVQLDSKTITCKDNDGNTVFEITVSADGSISDKFYTACSTFSDSISSPGVPLEFVGWQCRNGVFLDIHYISGGNVMRQYGILLTKNDHGKLFFVLSCYSDTPFFGNIQVLSWDDVQISAQFNITQVVRSQTMFCPFVSNPEYGTTSYTPNAFYMPVWQGFYGIGEFIAEGVRYWTNGYWAIRDE